MTLAPHQIELLRSIKPTDIIPTTLDYEWDHTDDMILNIIHDHGVIIAVGISHRDRNNEFLDHVVDDSDFFDTYQFDPEGISDEELEPAYCLGNASEFFDLEGFTWLSIPFPAFNLSDFINLIHRRYINADQEPETSTSGLDPNSIRATEQYL